MARSFASRSVIGGVEPAEPVTPKGPYALPDVVTGPGGVDLRLLRYFVAVAEELHFGEAARRLRIAQPALSSAVKVLETRLGVTLLRRTTRRVELTAVGEVLLDRSRRLLEAHTALLQEMAAHRRSEVSCLRLGYAGAFTGLLPATAVREAARSRARELGLHDVGHGCGLAPLLSHEVDAALLTSPLVDDDRAASLLLGYTPRMLAVSASHPISRTGHAAPVTRWSERHIGLEATTPGWSEFWSPDDFFMQPPAEHASSFERALELVAAGAGAIMAPAIAVCRCARADVAYLRVGGQARVGVYLAWRREDSPSLLKPLVPVLREALRQGSLVEATDELDWLLLVSTDP